MSVLQEFIPGCPPIYLGLYVDDFIYFSEGKQVEQEFEDDFGSQITIDFNGPITYFLGINFTTHCNKNGDVCITLTQTSFINHLAIVAGLGQYSTEPKSPCRSRLPVDSIRKSIHPDKEQQKATKIMQMLIGSLNWLAISTRPDIATITNMFAKYSATPNYTHNNRAKHIVKYLCGTSDYDITFTSKDNTEIEAFVKSPTQNNEIVALTDASWGVQDQSKTHPNKTQKLDLFKT